MNFQPGQHDNLDNITLNTDQQPTGRIVDKLVYEHLNTIEDLSLVRSAVKLCLAKALSNMDLNSSESIHFSTQLDE